MKKKNVPKRVANLICAIIQAAALFVFVFNDYASYYNYAIDSIEYDGFTFLEGAGTFGFFEVLSSGRPEAFVATVVFLVLGIIMCVVSALSNETRKDSFSHTIISVFALLSAGIASTELQGVITIGNSDRIIETYVNMATQTTLIVLLVIAIICNMIKRSNLINPKAATDKATHTPVYSAADELKKYKELLDNGAITQEEFDTKKKQLLGF